jgi:hypothetical protein
LKEGARDHSARRESCEDDAIRGNAPFGGVSADHFHRLNAVGDAVLAILGDQSMVESATPILAIHQALKLSRISLSLHIDRRDSIVDRLQIVRRQLYARAAKILFEPV